MVTLPFYGVFIRTLSLLHCIINPCKRKVRPVSFRTECLCTKRDCVKTVSTTKNHYHITTILHTTSFELTFLVLKNDQVKDKIALQC